MQRAVVTGASRGIGRAIAEGLVAAGLEVVGTSRAEPADPVGRWVRLDVRSDDDVAALAASVGPVDALVNNAGVALDGFDADVARRTLDVNVHGPRRVTDALLGQLTDGARIVMLSSGMGDLSCLRPDLRERFAAPDLERAELFGMLESFEAAVADGTYRAKGWPGSAYRVSKAALNALTRVYARELADDPRAITVHAACPGWVATDMGGASAPRTPAEGADTPIWLALEGGSLESGRFYRDRERIAY